jgi:hypothetical protein
MAKAVDAARTQGTHAMVAGHQFDLPYSVELWDEHNGLVEVSSGSSDAVKARAPTIPATAIPKCFQYFLVSLSQDAPRLGRGGRPAARGSKLGRALTH